MIRSDKNLAGKIFLFISLFSLILLSSCEEKATEIGIGLLKENTKLNVAYTDTIEVRAYTFTQDSVRSDKPTYGLSGTLNDPVFGTTYAAVITQMRLSQPLDPGHNVIVDSLILTLIPNKIYGDENTELSYQVFESFKTLRLEEIYYSNMDVTDSVGVNPVGTKIVHASDSIIQIYLDTQLGQKLLSDSAILQNQETFLNLFKGLYIAPPEIISGNGALIQLDLLSFDSKMDIYYQNDSKDSLFYTFIINTSCARANLFQHDFSAADPAQKINHLDDNIQDSVIYVQGASGVLSRIDIPYLDAWKDSLPIAVNKAELIIKISPDDSINQKIFTEPNQLDMYIKNEKGAYSFILDNAYGQDYFGGFLFEDAYSFSITAQIQKYFKEMYENPSADINSKFYLMINNGNYQANRVVLASPLNTLKLQFRFTYTMIRN